MATPAEALPEAENKNYLPQNPTVNLGQLARVAEVILGLQPIELDKSGLDNKRIIAVDTLLDSRRQVAEKHGVEVRWQPPSPNKYPDWFKWDEAFADDMFFQTAEHCWQQAELYKERLAQEAGEQQQQTSDLILEFERRAELYFQKAVDGINTTFEGMDQKGAISNTRKLTKSGVRQAGLERLITKDANVYTQPVLEPRAILAGYKAAIGHHPEKAKELLDSFYEPAKLHLSYIKQFLGQGKNSQLAGIPHPHASGRDSDFVFDHAKNRIPRSAEKTSRIDDLRNAGIDYRWALKRTKEIVEAGGDMAKIREGFWDRDVMFNVIYLESLYEMAELASYAGKGGDECRFLDSAELVEAEIQTLWDPEAWMGNGAFLNLNKEGRPIKKVSVGSLFGFGLRSLTLEQLQSMMTLAETSFNTPYGIPVTPTDSPDFGAHPWEIERIWQDDSSWDNVNYLILEMLERQAARNDISPGLRQRIANYAVKVDVSSNDALDKYWPPSEFRSAITGRPGRKRVNQFAWAMLPRFMHARQNLQHLGGENPVPEAA